MLVYTHPPVPSTLWPSLPISTFCPACIHQNSSVALRSSFENFPDMNATHNPYRADFFLFICSSAFKIFSHTVLAWDSSSCLSPSAHDSHLKARQHAGHTLGDFSCVNCELCLREKWDSLEWTYCILPSSSLQMSLVTSIPFCFPLVSRKRCPSLALANAAICRDSAPYFLYRILT